MILFDTDVCIELLRGNKKIIARRNNYSGDIAICFMTVAELYYGAEISTKADENKNLIEKFFLTVQIIQTDNEILKRFGKLKARLKSNSDLLPDADIMIAATSLVKAEKLITGNVKHFSRFKELKIEDWAK
ncbi:MAG: type II toxin-antitoxin system VapC family toxin [Thermodesulfobacteriota bacterium]